MIALFAETAGLLRGVLQFPDTAFYLIAAVVICILLIVWPIVWVCQSHVRIWRSNRRINQQHAAHRRMVERRLVGDRLVDEIGRRWDPPKWKQR